MKPIEEIEEELSEAYQRFDYKALVNWSDEQLQTRKEEILALQESLYKAHGEEAAGALDILACEYYDIDDEQQNRSA